MGKTISIVYQVDKCADCPFCKKGYCIRIEKKVDKEKMSNDCPLVNWGMYVRPDGKI